ncbi:L-2-hydroxyglutarate dehydrogenase [subsurface metagenome]
MFYINITFGTRGTVTQKMDANITIIGAGVIGLAIAAELSKEHSSVFVIEKNMKFGQEISSRNSEVIHSGVYYPEGSLKARLCVEGRELIYRFCEEKNVAYKKCGKLILAVNLSECTQLPGILEQSRKNGVLDAYIIDKPEIEKLEPHILAEKAIYFPSTGIIDTYGLMKQLETDAVNQGVQFVYGAKVIRIKVLKEGFEIQLLDSDGEKFSFTTRKLVNSAGLDASNIARSLGINETKYEVFFWKGEYFSVGRGKSRFIKRLVYTVPEKNTVGLGIHATVELDGRLRLGPNALYIGNGSYDYSVDPGHKEHFYYFAKRFLPFLEPEDLNPDQAGIRPKLQKPDDPVRDFIINEESNKGFPGLINLIGIESPGLTACLSIGMYVRKLIRA